MPGANEFNALSGALVESDAQLQALVLATTDTFAVNLATAAALAWMVHDSFLTFELEVSTIWRSRWSFSKGAFIFMRYYTIFALTLFLTVNTSFTIPFSVCKDWYWLLTFVAGPFLPAAVGEAMFIVRVNAMYAWDRKVVAYSWLMWIALQILNISVNIEVVRAIVVQPRPPDFPIPGCIALEPSNHKLVLVVWACACTLTWSLFLLTLYKFYCCITQFEPTATIRLQSLWRLRQLTPTLHLLFRDGAVYFFLIFVLQLLNLALSAVLVDRAIGVIGTPWVMAGYAVMSTRLLLNLRDPRGTLGQGTSRWNVTDLLGPPDKGHIAFAVEVTNLSPV